MKVAKFGGSSVSDADQFKKVKRIIESDPERKVVVVSAAGKSSIEPVKVTDMLIQIEEAVKNGTDFQQLFGHVSARILKIRDDLHLNVKIEKGLQEIKNKISTCSHDYLVSRGEYLTGKLMASYLDYQFIDPKNVLIFNQNELDYRKSNSLLNNVFARYQRVVIPGFYGADKKGNIHLMPRGGSDITGSIVSKLLLADLYENWTDVSGILMADPRIVSESKKIDVLTYDELQELSYMGIGVFQEEAIQPVRKSHIPTKILNTNHPEEGGTLVVDAQSHMLSDQIITGIAGKKNYTVITIRKYQLSKHIEVLQKVLSLLQKFHISVNYVPSGNDSFSFLFQKSEISSRLDKLVHKLQTSCGLDKVEVNQDIALIAAVSLKLGKNPAIAGKILDYLDNSLINVPLVIQEGGDIKIVIGVANQDYEKTIAKIYQEAMFKGAKRIPA
ncbi:aspartate kinase [Companilactobacillus versmoldensis]|uniref:Aspartokinase n=1 Tax=Companilactobacillus versmoldensis DSM 14857 = KCTC 3814 TaxID=1423815 RepID=A0A0R1SGA9_9LACO|nr:aspartate kinase [Companilactobacillus versmoldensis]KRL68192.1 aspartate kinase [Companilactobacillus versmoldensis DSM 14857 = KCTC 3814]